MNKRDIDKDLFYTARSSQGFWRITWAFFAGSVGSWCIAAPPSFAVYTGIVGLAMYSVASGFPLLVLCLFGYQVLKLHPNVVSIGDFAGKRFGPTLKLVVVLIVLFNMGIALTAEYTTVGSLFEDFVGSKAWPIIITIGVVTMAYTCYGGLLISIVTDQVQAIATITFIAILTIYTAVTFRAPLPMPLPNDVNYGYNPWTGYVSWPLGANKFGYSAIFSMPCSLIAATVFSEAMWQKVWASKDKKAMIGGGFLASVLVMIAVFLFGFGGWLAAWAGWVNYNTNGNLFLFQVFNSETSMDALPAWVHEPDMGYPPPYVSAYPDAPPGSVFSYLPYSARLKSWVGLITLLTAVIMSQSAVDSMQNGLTSCLGNHFFPDQNIIFARILVFCINVPVMIVGTRKYKVLQLFLISNMLTTCWFLPLLSGMFDYTRDYVGETGVLFSGSAAILSTIFYSAGRWWYHAGNGHDAFECGSWYAWFGNINYDWDYFLVASGTSVIAMLFWGAMRRVANYLCGLCGVEAPGISGILCYLPGFKFLTGGGLGFDLLAAMGLGRFGAAPSAYAVNDDDKASDVIDPDEKEKKENVAVNPY